MRRAKIEWALALAAAGALAGASLLAACNQPAAGSDRSLGAGEAEASAEVPAGTTCAGRRDCGSDQLCVGGVCRHRHTSTSGEILAAAAKGQIEAGDVGGAVGTYAQAIEAFREVEAPLPADVACGAAAAALRVAEDPASRETAASYADACFRSSLPGDPSRVEVQRALARLRFDGLDMALFDRSEPAERYFTKQQSRPTTDAIEIALSIPDRDHAGYTTLSEALHSEDARQAIAGCFVQDWESRHQRSVSASLLMKFDTNMRDMGDYDVFVSDVQVSPASGAEEGFEPCVAQALTEAVQPGPRMPYPVRAWQETFEVAARLQ